MGQVPAFKSYLIVGNGRVARHFRRYLTFAGLPFFHWSRELSENRLRELAAEASHVLLLITDSEIEGFVKNRPYLGDCACVHFSGSLFLTAVAGTHPLMTFSDELYDESTYREIPFIYENTRGAFQDLLPGIENPHYPIDPGRKTLYHALCVLSGNFTVLLWEKAFNTFAKELGLPREVLIPYLRRTCENLAGSKGASVLTGPLVRQDFKTIDRHLSALKGDPYGDVYRAFVAAYSQGQTTGGLR